LPTSLLRPTSKRTDGRRVAEEYLQAFQLALADAALKLEDSDSWLGEHH